ncbi:MAG TPA: DegQ family serine endoprotease [Arenimonas sp.]|nr:DegQ family serine endoprotease [Arenimonas sp.]
MTRLTHHLALLVVALALPLTACQAQPSATLAAANSAATEAATSASPVVVNLPDFTPLVERAGPAVVYIEATSGGRDDDGGRADQAPEQEIPEIFRRFFGPGFPGVPQQPGPRFGRSSGSGFIISADGYVLTNHHVIDGADEVVVRLSDRRELVAKVVGSDALSDVALLKLDAKGLPMLRIGDSRNLKPGQWVMAIGSPFGFEHSVTAGIVSGVGRRSADRTQQYVPFIQTDVAINRGNSGGPLLDTRGEVVGINSQIFSNTGGFMGVSFAIPIEVAMNAAEQLKTGGTVKRGQLGVQIQDVDRELARSYGMERPMGAAVTSVTPGSAAEKAGIKLGDVITAFDGQEIHRSSDLPPLVGATTPGTRATVKLLRDGKPRELAVVLDTLSESSLLGGVAAPREAAGSNVLGLAVDELPAAARSQLGLQEGEGVRVVGVEGAAARRAGIAPGDVILMVGSREVGSVADFDAALGGVSSGDSVRLLVRNAQGARFVAITAR